MISFIVDLIACGAAATSILYAHISGVHSQRSGQHAMDAAAFSRRDAERRAAEPDALEVDHGKVVALRLVHPEEAREQLIDAALMRHPAGKRRNSPQSSPRDEETVTPGAAVAVDAPGVAPKP